MRLDYISIAKSLVDFCGAGFTACGKIYFVIPFTVSVHGEPSEARNLFFFCWAQTEERFARNDKRVRALFPHPVQPVGGGFLRALTPKAEAGATRPAARIGLAFKLKFSAPTSEISRRWGIFLCLLLSQDGSGV
jgi:hypothetical protein